MNIELLTLWSDQPGLSLLIWLIIAIVIMYCGRRQAHQVLKAAGRGVYRFMRLFSRAVGQMETHLFERNRDILLAAGADALERRIEREFVRVNAHVSRDLAHYPALHRQISDTIDEIEKDYKAATDSPPLPPAWLDAVESIAAIPRNGDPAVCKILKNIHKTVESAYRETEKAFQKNTLERHRLLSGMQPHWRTLVQTMNKVSDKIEGLDERSKQIDHHMSRYEKMRAGDNDVMRVLASSSLTQFFISGLVLVIAALGGLINFQLIAMPMSEMVGGTSYIGAIQTSDIAALVIIMIEIAMGIFLLEALRITRLFPMIGSLDDTLRKRMAIIALVILTILASIEASLAYMRDLLAMDREALRQSLAGAVTAEVQLRWIPSIGQMIMGFILPFALAFVAIPLESFIHSVRTVIGMIAIAVLRVIAVSLRLFGSLFNQLSTLLVSVYDLIIMLPLLIENAVHHYQNKDQANIKATRHDVEAISESYRIEAMEEKSA